jgi:hypothetical protein
VCPTVLKPPKGKAAVVTSIIVNAYDSHLFELQLLGSSDGSCNITTNDRAYYYFTTSTTGTTELTFNAPSGLDVQAGTALCADNSSSTATVYVGAWGYAVNANQVPPS